MPKKYRYVSLAISAAFTLAAFFFLGYGYTYHIHYQEQMQLFQFTWAYFADTVAPPGGFADWCGRFLTQFFYYARGGAAVLALLLLAVQLLTYSSIGQKNLLALALSFIPSIFLFIFYLDENAIVGAAVAIVFCLAAVRGVQSVRNATLRTTLLLVGVPIMYFLCGPLALLYALAACRKAKVHVWVVSLALLALCPLAGQYLFPYPLDRLIRGIHYYRYPLVLPLWLPVAALSSAAICISGLFKYPQGRIERISAAATLVLTAALACPLAVRSADMVKEEVLSYDFMLQHRMWNRIMLTADRKNPTAPLSVSCLNLALGKTGRLNTDMFDYYQNGPEGLLPSFVRDFTSPIPTGEIYWHLGMVNTAQRFFFEAQEAIPDFQKSARCYKKLAETNIVNGDLGVARKYLEALQNTLFYRSWAKKTAGALASTTGLTDFPEYALLRDFRLKHHDFLFSDREIDSMLGLLYMEDQENAIAYDYLLVWNLLKKDLDRFMECFSVNGFKRLPRHYQEAVLLHCVLSGSGSMPAGIDSSTTSGMEAFIKALREKKSESHMKEHFGNTYWFYYYYRYNRN